MPTIRERRLLGSPEKCCGRAHRQVDNALLAGLWLEYGRLEPYWKLCLVVAAGKLVASDIPPRFLSRRAEVALTADDFQPDRRRLERRDVATPASPGCSSSSCERTATVDV
ncbi:MAG: hypothetical protein IPO51_15910 [Dehalococcoidia bacterium]|nr:hypothetical protein [Dehalococcoidia bacterium]